MQGLGTLFLLLTACLASRADPVPDIQVQENFSESRVRLASLTEIDTVVAYLCHWAFMAETCLSGGGRLPVLCTISQSLGGPPWVGYSGIL